MNPAHQMDFPVAFLPFGHLLDSSLLHTDQKPDIKTSLSQIIPKETGKMKRIDAATQLLIDTVAAGDRRRGKEISAVALEVMAFAAPDRLLSLVATGEPIRVDLDVVRLAVSLQHVQARLDFDEGGVHLIFERATPAEPGALEKLWGEAGALSNLR